MMKSQPKLADVFRLALKKLKKATDDGDCLLSCCGEIADAHVELGGQPARGGAFNTPPANHFFNQLRKQGEFNIDHKRTYSGWWWIDGDFRRIQAMEKALKICEMNGY